MKLVAFQVNALHLFIAYYWLAVLDLSRASKVPPARRT